MDKRKKIVEAVSTSAMIILGWGNIATAEELSGLPQPGNYYRSKEFLLAEFPIIPRSLDTSSSQISSRARELVSQELPIQVSQSTESQPQTLPKDTERLNPNANPLLFPTDAEEVQTNIDRPITLEQAIELALRNNKDLQVAKLTLQRRKQELREARADLFPDLSTNVTLINAEGQSDTRLDLSSGEIDTGDDDDTSRDNNLNTNISLDYNIYSGGGIRANIKRAKKQLRFDELAVETAVEQTRFEAARDYYSLQDADAQVEIEQAAIEDATQTLRDAQLLEQAGLGTRFDVLRAEVELANAEQAFNTAVATQQGARRQLAETLSIGQQVELQTADEIEEAGIWSLSLEETIVLAYRNRAELEQQVVLRELNQQQRQIALAQIRPQVTLFADYDYNAIEIFEDRDDDSDFSFGARLSWTLFDGGTADAQSDESETDIEINETQFADQRNNVRLEVEQAYYSLQANQKNIGTAQKAVELAEESLRLARLRFQAGVGTQTDVIDAQTQLTTARGNFLTAIIDYNQSLNQLQRAVTNLPEGKLFDLP